MPHKRRGNGGLPVRDCTEREHEGCCRKRLKGKSRCQVNGAYRLRMTETVTGRLSAAESARSRFVAHEWMNADGGGSRNRAVSEGDRRQRF
jgi:hypothetical protein